MSKKVRIISSVIVALYTIIMAIISSVDAFGIVFSNWLIISPAIVFCILNMIIPSNKKQND